LKQWRNAAVVGVLMLSCGNGGVTWAEIRLPSGLAAIMVATVSLWLLLLNWAFGNKKRPTASQAAGLAIGLLGLVVLVMPNGQGLLGKGTDLVGAGVILVGALGWAGGTLFARQAELPASPWMTNGGEMLFGGVALIVVGTVSGERVRWAAVSAQSLGALAYLVVFGSIIAFSAYTWLNKATTPARLGTYAYVNPAVAVLLGAIFAGEPITARSVVAMLLILSGVVMLSLVRKPLVELDSVPIKPLSEPCAVAAE
jgi:drug/metabolite transporter (DMT)-like permease